MERYCIRANGDSRSFPEGDAFVSGAQPDGELLLLIGQPRLDPGSTVGFRAVLVELGNESLAEHTGGREVPESSNIVGFARWRLGAHAPSRLVELVVEPATKADAIAAARALFTEAGFVVSTCADRIGRIVDRLMRPQFNLALRAIDDGVADPKDMEQCLKLGLGYRNGLVEPLLDSGLEHHFDVTTALFQIYGQAQYAPARQAVVAKARSVEAKRS
jgi:3-hydroxybutyryl-CoA dehydrogenase